METNLKPAVNFLKINQLKEAIEEKSENDGEGFMKEYEVKNLHYLILK